MRTERTTKRRTDSRTERRSEDKEEVREKDKEENRGNGVKSPSNSSSYFPAGITNSRRNYIRNKIYFQQ